MAAVNEYLPSPSTTRKVVRITATAWQSDGWLGSPGFRTILETLICNHAIYWQSQRLSCRKLSSVVS